MHWVYISGQGTPWRLSRQARVIVALRGRPACGGSAALIHPITCFLVSLPFPSAKACGNRRASRWAKLSTCSRIGCHSGDGFWEQMGTKSPGLGGVFAEGAVETQGFTVVGLILGARGPRFESARPDQHPKGLRAQSGFSKSTSSYHAHAFHKVLTTFDAASRFSAETARV